MWSWYDNAISAVDVAFVVLSSYSNAVYSLSSSSMQSSQIIANWERGVFSRRLLEKKCTCIITQLLNKIFTWYRDFFLSFRKWSNETSKSNISPTLNRLFLFFNFESVSLKRKGDISIFHRKKMHSTSHAINPKSKIDFIIRCSISSLVKLTK